MNGNGPDFGVRVRHLGKFVLLFVVSMALFLGLQKVPSLQAQEGPPPRPNVITPALQQQLANTSTDELIPILIQLDDKVDRQNFSAKRGKNSSFALISALQDQAFRSQQRVRALLATAEQTGQAAESESLWIINAIAVKASPTLIRRLAQLPEVIRIRTDEQFSGPSFVSAEPPPEINLDRIQAPRLWTLGWKGQDVVVASMDTGVDVTHPDLAPRWRGGDNSWFDPYREHPHTPVDRGGNSTGHGTWTTGIMVGDAQGGTAIGVAPAAQWIAVKIFNDAGQATFSKVHAAFQWLLDPDGDPRTQDAPHIVNGSWTFRTPGCDLEFEPDLQTLRAADIFPVFAAGNGGPNPASDYSPGNNPSAFSVGAVTAFDTVFYASSRGPTRCGGPESIFPDMVAPGVNIRVADPPEFYTNESGTSMAAPHVSGALALLLSAYPDLSVAEQEEALLQGAIDLGPPGPDNDYGQGRLDVYRAYEWLMDHFGNRAPQVDAGPDRISLELEDIPLSGTARDDLLPRPHQLHIHWYAINPPGPVRFKDPEAINTTVSVDWPGLYTFRLVVDDGEYATGDDVLVSVEPSSLQPYYVSFSSNGHVGALPFAGEDILVTLDSGHSWALLFDGSDVGLGSTDVDALAIQPDGSILLSVSDPIVLPALGQVDDADILRFVPSSLGENTAGTFEVVVRGEAVGLGEDGEDIDALAPMPDGRFIISTLGDCMVDQITYADEDLLLLDANAGTWTLLMRGVSEEFEQPSEDIWGTAIDRDQRLYVALKGAFRLSSLTGEIGDVLLCRGFTLPATKGACQWQRIWTSGIPLPIDGLHVGGPFLVPPGTVPLVAEVGTTDGEFDQIPIDDLDDPNNGDIDPPLQIQVYLPNIWH